ncbi:unnamed protein product [Ectocarpus sp. 12 AP-2014]
MDFCACCLTSCGDHLQMFDIAGLSGPFRRVLRLPTSVQFPLVPFKFGFYLSRYVRTHDREMRSFTRFPTVVNRRGNRSWCRNDSHFCMGSAMWCGFDIKVRMLGGLLREGDSIEMTARKNSGGCAQVALAPTVMQPLHTTCSSCFNTPLGVPQRTKLLYPCLCSPVPLARWLFDQPPQSCCSRAHFPLLPSSLKIWSARSRSGWSTRRTGSLAWG